MTAMDARSAQLLAQAIRLPSVRARCEDALVGGIVAWPAIRFAVLSTVDGTPFVARAIDGDPPAMQLGELSRDLMDVARAIAAISDIGGCRHLAIEHERGSVIAVPVPQTASLFILTVVGDHESSMGMTLRAALDLSQRVVRTLESATSSKANASGT